MPAQTAEEKMLQRRVADLIHAVRQGAPPRYTGFLNERERELAVAQLNREGWQGYAFNGGYQDAERVMLCVFEDNGEVSFPLQAVQIQGGVQARGLTHRDYLGALLGLGIRRDCVGDILPRDDGAAAILQQAAAALAQQQLAQVGRVAVSAGPAQGLPGGPAAKAAEKRRASVASLRLDAVLAAMLGEDRAGAAQRVRRDEVMVNHRLPAARHEVLAEQDLISVRGVGRFQLASIGGQSKKGRTWIDYLVF